MNTYLYELHIQFWGSVLWFQRLELHSGQTFCKEIDFAQRFALRKSEHSSSIQWETEMISYEDCAAMCGLDLSQIAAIAEHEHVPEVAAAALGNYLLHKAGGEMEIQRMLADDIRIALGENRLDHATELLMALRHFMSCHPNAAVPFANFYRFAVG